MGTTIDYSLDTKSETLTCANCGIPFAVPARWAKARREDHVGWFCPNGHSLHFPGKTKEEKRLEQLERDNDWYQKRLRAETDAAQSARRSAAAMRGVLTRTRNRIAAGTCPCCDKHFKVLAKHMEAEHPEFTSEPVDPA